MNKYKLIYKILMILILFLFIDNVSAVNMTERSANCVAILDYEGITTLVGGLGLMILGFSLIVHSLRVENPTLILLGIFTVIIGFGSLILGNYIFSAIHSVLC